MAELTQEDVRQILEIIDRMQDCEVRLEIGDLKLHVSPRAQAAAPVAAAPAPAGLPQPSPKAAPAPQRPAAQAVPAGQVAVRAPTVGTFYRASSPGAKPFVEVGDRVGPEDTVAVFEVMKLFSSLKAEVAGTVAAILVANETLVEADQPLILIAPAA